MYCTTCTEKFQIIIIIIIIIINDRLSMVYSRNLYRSAVVDNIRRRIVGVMFPPSIFDASTFEDRCVDFRRSRSRVDLRRSMC